MLIFDLTSLYCQLVAAAKTESESLFPKDDKDGDDSNNDDDDDDDDGDKSDDKTGGENDEKEGDVKDKDKINEQSKILLTIETLITFSEVNSPLIKYYGFY